MLKSICIKTILIEYLKYITINKFDNIIILQKENNKLTSKIYI